MTGQLAAYLFGMAVGLLCGAVGIGSLIRWLDRQIDEAVTLPPRHERAAEPYRAAAIDPPRHRVDEWA